MKHRRCTTVAIPARNAQRSPWGDAGVTLLELLIVLMLMALIAAVTIPIFGPGVSTTELRSAAREVAAGLRLARGQAITQRTDAVLELNVATRSFWVPPDPRVHALPAGIELKLFTAQNDIVNDQVGAIRFYPDGGSNGGRVTLAAGERKYDVDVDWLTGRVAILE
jgi:general secretion pathway protein H